MGFKIPHLWNTVSTYLRKPYYTVLLLQLIVGISLTTANIIMQSVNTYNNDIMIIRSEIYRSLDWTTGLNFWTSFCYYFRHSI